MLHRPRKITLTLLGVAALAVALAIPTALAGSGVGGVFNLGQTNTVDAQSILTGNPGGNPLLKVVGTGTAATLRAQAGTGIAVNGVSTSGTGQYGQSTSGNGLYGTHTGSTGGASGVYGVTASTNAASAGVTGQNTAGGPGLQSIVTSSSIPPLKVNSNAKVTNLNADQLDGLDSTGFWKLGGNAAGATGVLGTTDSQALELKVNGARALRIEPDATSPNLIGGSSANGNPAASGAHALTIAGGGDAFDANEATDNYGTIGGGFSNIAGDLDADPGTAEEATVSGGAGNTAGASSATVGGGDNNVADGQRSTVSGGTQNQAHGLQSAIAGGGGNTTGASALDAFVAGGDSNTASGNWSFAAGRRAKATQAGSFVWGDSTDADVSSSNSNTFTVRASNGVIIKAGGLATATNVFTNGATTPSVSGGNVFSTNNTNPTTITNFISSLAGQTITIVFLDSNTTIQDSADIQLQGSTNFTGGVNDTLTIVNLNGMQWFEVARSDN